VHVFTSALVGGEWLVAISLLLCHREKSRLYPYDRNLGGAKSQSERRGEEKNPSFLSVAHRVASCRNRLY
jgi:hypothetical protein